MKKYFVTAIHTDSGKSVVSVLLARVLGYDYWKPVQAGHPTDISFVSQFLAPEKIIHEKYLLKTACSPHQAANIDNVEISVDDFSLSNTTGGLIVEGAGGLMVPINNEGDCIIDIIKKLDIEVVLVSNHYLGSINHTLLSIEALKANGIKVKGIIFNGEENQGTESIILKKSGLPMLFRLDQEAVFDDAFFNKYSEIIKEKLG